MEINNWSTHIPVIEEVLKRYPDSRFLELGTGHGSTPLIIKNTRESIHLETDISWFKEMIQFERENHKIELFEDFSLRNWNCSYFDQNWDVCFIDNAPGESRQSNLLKLSDKCKLIICHDTEEIISGNYNYGWDFTIFKYVYTHTEYPVTTTVCSNTIDFKM